MANRRGGERGAETRMNRPLMANFRCFVSLAALDNVRHDLFHVKPIVLCSLWGNVET